MTLEDKIVEYDDWYITCAPKTLDEVFGQNVITNYIRGEQKSGKWDKAVMFTGEFGSGKTILAKIAAKSIACKNKNKDGEPCGTCPTCLAIDNETWDRDVVYIDAESSSAQDVRDIVEKNMLTPAIRDAAKVFIVDETQALSKEGVEAFLIATQSPRKNVFFFFTAMSKLAGQKSGALESRCKKWRLKQPTNDEIYLYLADVCKRRELVKDKDIPKNFFGEGLKFIAENCKSSFRVAIQMLQQCYKGQIYDIKVIKETFEIVSYEETAAALIELAHGKITDNVFNIVVGNEYQDKYPLLLNIIGDARTYSAFKKLFNEEENKWKEKLPASLAAGKYFSEIENTFLQLGESAYIRRGDWKIAISRLVYKIKDREDGLIPPNKGPLPEGVKVKNDTFKVDVLKDNAPEPPTEDVSPSPGENGTIKVVKRRAVK